ARPRVIHTDERLARAVGKEGHRATRLIADDAHVPALLIDRPWLDAREAVRAHELGRIDEARVVPDLRRRIAPPVVPMTDVARVVQIDTLLEDGASRLQVQFHAPARSEDLVRVADPDRAASVGLLYRREVDRRHRH